MSWLLIEPTDVWMFRDGRPFIAGEGHTVSTLFPPTPFTMQGALRSLILASEPVDWPEFWHQTTTAAQTMGQKIGYPAHEKNGKTMNASLGDFAMQGPFLSRWLPNEGRAELLVKRPLDSYQVDDKGNKYWHSLQPQKIETVWTDWPGETAALAPLIAACSSQKLEESEHPLLLAEDGLLHYLAEQPFQMSPEATFVDEFRLGIALNYDRRRPKDRMIYSLEYKRPSVKQFGTDAEPCLLVNLGEGVELPEKQGVLAIGGEARAARYRVLEKKEEPKLPKMEATKRLKVLLLTPAWFSNGWHPGDDGWGKLLGNPAGLRLVAAAIGRSHYIGGWRVPDKGWHKPMRAFVPAGSVYFFEADEEIDPITVFTHSPADAIDFAKQGFGACASGHWSWLTEK